MESCSVLPHPCSPVLIYWLLPAQERRGQAVNTLENQRMLSEGGNGITNLDNNSIRPNNSKKADPHLRSLAAFSHYLSNQPPK